MELLLEPGVFRQAAEAASAICGKQSVMEVVQLSVQEEGDADLANETKRRDNLKDSRAAGAALRGDQAVPPPSNGSRAGDDDAAPGGGGGGAHAEDGEASEGGGGKNGKKEKKVSQAASLTTPTTLKHRHHPKTLRPP